MRLESAEHHRADPNRAPVANAGHPNHGDRTVRFPVVMAGSRVSLVSLAGTYSTALFAMMSTPQWPAAPTLCPSANARCGPAADRKVSKKGLRLQADCGKTTCRSTHECYGRLASFQELGMIGVLTHHWAKVEKIDEE